jgi:hypothetical protein
MRKLSLLAGGLVVLGMAGAANATLFTFDVFMTGAQEAPGPGDADGFGEALMTIDDSFAPPRISWLFSPNNIAFPLSGAHIHQAPFGVQGSVVVNFSAQLSGSGLADADLVNVLANPAGFYVNLHNSFFPNGAIRGQLPEPASMSLLALGGLAILRRRK